MVSRDQIWVIDATAKAVDGLSLADGSVQTHIELGEFCTDLARTSSGRPSAMLYAVCPTSGVVLAIDPESKQVTAKLRLPNPRVAELGDDLWVGFDGGVAQVSPDDLTVKAVYDALTGLDGTIFVTTNAVWVRAGGKQMLTQIDPSSQTFVETIAAGKYKASGDLLVKGDSIWTTASDDSVLMQVQTTP